MYAQLMFPTSSISESANGNPSISLLLRLCRLLRALTSIALAAIFAGLNALPKLWIFPRNQKNSSSMQVL
jgi:hypothetical protein